MTTLMQVLGTSTPLSEAVVSELGLVKGAIVCRIFFYQQLKDGVCKATTATIAEKLGLSKTTVSTNIKWLLEHKWIENTEPLKKGNVSNHFRVTQKFYDCVDDQRSGDERNVQEMNGKEDIKEDLKENKEGASASPPQKKKKPKTEPKPAAAHVYRENAHLWPAKSTWQDLDQAIGDNQENLSFWGRVVKAWIMCGWNPRNIKGMLDFYKRREIPNTNGKRKAQQNDTHYRSNPSAIPLSPKQKAAYLAIEQAAGAMSLPPAD